MAEEENAPQVEAPTVESIAAEYNLGNQAPEPPTPQPAPVAAPIAVPDPVTDAAGFQAWLGQQAQQTAEMQRTLNDSMSKDQARQEAEQRNRDEQELNALVDKVHGEIGDGVSKNLVKYALADRYNSNPAFKAILDNRNVAPEAMDKALGAIMPELRSEFSIKADPQIAENQRAMSESTSSSRQPQSVPTDERDVGLMRQPQAEFEHNWEKLKNGM